MIGTWVLFAAWTLTYNHQFAGDVDGQPVAIVMGMPKWVVFGIVIPWVIALSVTVWFALSFMKDTPLEEQGDVETKEAG